MKDDQWFFISNFDEFVDHSRSLVFNYFGEANEAVDDSMTTSISQMTKEEISEMDKTLTHEESAVIIKNHAKKQINRKTKEVRYCMNDKILQTIIEDLNSRMVSNILNVLVGKGMIESAYDNEKNDFIFWIKDDEDNTKQKEIS